LLYSRSTFKEGFYYTNVYNSSWTQDLVAQLLMLAVFSATPVHGTVRFRSVLVA